MFDMFNIKPKVVQEPPINAELLLIMGDVHIPSRIDAIPEDVKTLLVIALILSIIGFISLSKSSFMYNTPTPVGPHIL